MQAWRSDSSRVIVISELPAWDDQFMEDMAVIGGESGRSRTGPREVGLVEVDAVSLLAGLPA